MLNRPQASRATAVSEVHSAGNAAVSSRRTAGHVDDDGQSCGAVSPRAARSQISTAVSFEGARPAGSVAVAARSTGGDSAHSFADHEGENSSVLAAAPAGHQMLAQPTTSLLSTAVRNGSPPPRAPGSPELYRASSVVSYTEAGHHAAAQRAGTPASVYAQGRVNPVPATRANSPVSRAEEQESESEGGRHSRSSKVQHKPAKSLEAPPLHPYLEVAQKLSSQVSGKLSLEPPRKRVKTDSPLHSMVAGPEPMEGTARPAAGEADAQSSRRIHGLRKSNSRQAESGPVNNMSPHSSQFPTFEPAFDALQDRPSNLPRAQRLSIQGRGQDTPPSRLTGQGRSQETHSHQAERLVMSQLEFPPSFNAFQGVTRAPLERLVESLPLQHHALQMTSSRPEASGRNPSWEGFTLERTSVGRLPDKAANEGVAGKKTSEEVKPVGNARPQRSARALTEEPLPDGAFFQAPEGQKSPVADQRGLASHERHHQTHEQGAHTPADSVLGDLHVDDGGSEINTQPNLRSLQSTLSENGMHIPDLANPAVRQDPSFQASIVPNGSADGEAAAAMGLALHPEQLASAASNLDNSQVATEQGGLDPAARPASIRTQDVVEGRKPSKHSQSQKAESQNIVPGPTPGSNVQQTVPAEGGNANATDTLLHQPALQARQASDGPASGLRTRGSPSAKSRLPAVSEGTPAPAVMGQPGDEPFIGLPLPELSHSHSAAAPAVAVVDHEANGAADPSEMVAQSHPDPDADPEPPAPRPALTVFMPEGLLGPVTEPDDGAAWPLRREAAGNEPSSPTRRCSSEVKSGSAGSLHSGRLRSDTAKRRKLLAEQSPKTVASS